MTRRITYATGLAAVTTAWTTDVFKWVLVEAGWVPLESTDIYIDSISGFEFMDTAYARQTMTSPSVSVQLPAAEADPGYIQYLCDDPDFGVMSGGRSATGLILYREVTTDADSPIVAVYPVGYTANGGSGVFNATTNGAVVISTVCPAEF